VAAVSIQVVIWEASAGHQPRGLSNNLRRITICVTVDAIEHLSIAVFVLDLTLQCSRKYEKGIPNNRSDIVSGKHISILCSKLVRNHNEWNFIGS
jgi:hypothetical protein